MIKVRMKFIYYLLTAVISIGVLFFIIYFSFHFYLKSERSKLEKEVNNFEKNLDISNLSKGKKGEYPSTLFSLSEDSSIPLYHKVLVRPKDEVTMMKFSNIMHDYLESFLESQDDDIKEPPKELKEILKEKNSDFEKLREDVFLGDFPEWEKEEEGYTVDMFNVNQLGNWFGVKTVIFFKNGDRENALRSFASLKRLIDGLLSTPKVTLWLCAVNLSNIYALIERKTFLDTNKLKIDNYEDSLRLILLKKAKESLQICTTLEEGLFYKNDIRREKFFWRSYGRLWLRNSFLIRAKESILELKRINEFPSCSSFQFREAPYFKSGYFMFNNEDIENYDLEMRLKRLYLNFELTNWAKALCFNEDFKKESIIFNCPEVEVIERNKDGKIEIGFKTQMDREAKEGIIDVPLLFTFEKK